MKIAYNPSTLAALKSPPDNKDITFDLTGHNIYTRGVKFAGTDTWRPVVDNLTSSATDQSLSANQGKELLALINTKAGADHTHYIGTTEVQSTAQAQALEGITNIAMTGCIQSSFMSRTWLNGMSNAALTLNHTGYSAAISMPVLSGKVTLSTYPGGNSNEVYLGYISTTNISAGNNSLDKVLKWNAVNGVLTADNYVGLWGGYKNDLANVNTTDTSVPVLTSKKELQYRTIPLDYNNPASSLSVSYADVAGKTNHIISLRDLNGVTQNYDGSADVDLTAGTYMSLLPYGFNSWSSEVTWGNTTGTSFACWNDDTGGAIDFRKDNPISGKLSLKVNGRLYASGGAFPAVLAESDGEFWSLRTPDGENMWLRVGRWGIIPEEKGNAGNGHSLIGSPTWYFNASYIDSMHGTADKALQLYINTTNVMSTWDWTVQTGQPTYLWGSTDGSTMYPWELSTLNVNHATSAGKLDNAIKLASGASNTVSFDGSTEVDLSESLNAQYLCGHPGNIIYGGVPWITSAGVMEIGKYIDFHYESTTSTDYSTRIRANGEYQNVVNLPSASGTLALVEQLPSVTSYYWANVAISSESSTSTTPTFGTVTAAGNIYASHFYESSDKALKTNIKSITTVSNMPKIREFDWKDSGEHSYGFIAQELEEQGYGNLVDNTGEHKTVNYTAALALTMAKMQNIIEKQNKKIDKLSKEIKSLKYGRQKNS